MKNPIHIGHVEALYSDILQEERTFSVYLPKSYSAGAEPYPVLYQLDGEGETFVQAAMAAWYLTTIAERIPEHIIIGIGNTDRARDMAAERGAGDFLRFLGSELGPHVERHYRAGGSRLLCGQSSSSLFACYAMLRASHLFDAYVMNSFGLSNRGLELYRGYLDAWEPGPSPIALFVANARHDPFDPDGARSRNGVEFLAALESGACPKVRLRHKYYEDEGHVPYPGLYDGLKWIYGG